jgi:hypothetical protein
VEQLIAVGGMLIPVTNVVVDDTLEPIIGIASGWMNGFVNEF